METPISAGVHRSIKLSLASSKQIADCLVFADLFDSLSYCSTPFVNQCLFIAGVAFIHDAQNEDLGLGGAQSEFISGLVRQNLSALLKALKRMQLYWGGVAYVIDVSALYPQCTAINDRGFRCWNSELVAVAGQRSILSYPTTRNPALSHYLIPEYCGEYPSVAQALVRINWLLWIDIFNPDSS